MRNVIIINTYTYICWYRAKHEAVGGFLFRFHFSGEALFSVESISLEDDGSLETSVRNKRSTTLSPALLKKFPMMRHRAYKGRIFHFQSEKKINTANLHIYSKPKNQTLSIKTLKNNKRTRAHLELCRQKGENVEFPQNLFFL